jgi:hypothetical protein
MNGKINRESIILWISPCLPKITNQFGFIHDHLILLIKNPMD